MVRPRALASLSQRLSDAKLSEKTRRGRKRGHPFGGGEHGRKRSACRYAGGIHGGVYEGNIRVFHLCYGLHEDEPRSSWVNLSLFASDIT